MLVDSQQRQEALDIENSYLIKAPAGSGKTGLLTNRTLVALASVDSLDEVVGMTFTNKAAQEMKDRLGLSMQRAQNGYVPLNDFEAQNLSLAKAALVNSDKHGWGLGESCEHLNISTIDSFCRTLLKGRFEQSEHLSISMDVMADATVMYEYAARMVLSKCEDDTYGETVRTLLSHFGNRASKVEELLVVTLQKRDRWLEFVFKGRMETKTELEANRAQFVESVFYKESREIRHFESQLQEVFTRMNTPAEMITFLNDGFEKDLVGSYEAIAYMSGVLLSSKLESKSRFTVKDGVPADKAEKKEVVELLKTLSHELAPILKELTYLPDNQFKTTEWTLLNALFDIMPLALASLKLAFNKYSKVDFTEVALAAVFALNNDSELGATDAAIRKTQTIRHLLIDEFQDSSDLQMKMLKMIVDAWSGEQACSLFLVGDAMQSLYSFRGASVSQFMTAESGVGELLMKVLSLHTNFRSSRGVVDWVNRVFVDAFPQEDNLVVSACSYNASTAVKRDDKESPVEVHGFADDDGECSNEAAFILSQIKEIKCREPNASIAVLGRTRTALKPVLDAFEVDMGVDKVDINLSLLKTDPTAKVIVSLAKALSNPTDDISLYALMTSPLIGLSTAQVSQLKERKRCLCESIRFYGHEGFVGFDSDTVEVLEVLRAVFNDVDRSFHASFQDVLVSAWDRLSGGSTLKTPDDQYIADTIFSLFDNEESSVITDKYINDKISALYKPVMIIQEGSNPVQFMTIHQSKGLEFDYVFIPSAGKMGRVNPGQLMQWAEMKQGGESLSVLATSQEMGISKNSSQYIKFLNRLQSRKEREEMVRLGYVAVTRAISQVFITASLSVNKDDGLINAPSGNSLLGMMFDSIQDDIVMHECDVIQGTEEVVIQPTVSKIQRFGDIAIEGRNILSTYESADVYTAVTQNNIVWLDDASRHEGVVIHKLIEQIGLEGLNKWDHLRLKMYKGVIYAMLKEMIGNTQQLIRSVKRVCDEIDKAVDCAVFRDLAGDHRCDELELRVALKHNGKLNYLIIDKGFIDKDGTGMVVDWKSAIDRREDNVSFVQFQQGVYKRKMAMYKKAYAEIHGIDSVGASLYFTSLNQAVGI